MVRHVYLHGFLALALQLHFASSLRPNGHEDPGEKASLRAENRAEETDFKETPSTTASTQTEVAQTTTSQAEDTTNRTWPWQNEDYLRVGLAMFTTGVAYIVTYLFIELSAWIATRKLKDPFFSIADAPLRSLHDRRASKSAARSTCLGCWSTGDTQVPTFEEALRGLTPSQQAFFENTMKRAHALQVRGIQEQRRSVGWKWVECICVALTPICISISDSFGKHFQEPIKLIAILFSLFSTLCRLSPQGRGEALLFYSGLLRKVCWSYWSVSGEFDDFRYDSDFDEHSKEVAQEFWQKFSAKKRECKEKLLTKTMRAGQSQAQARTEDPAEQSQIHAGTEDRADQEGEDPASSMFETAFVECLPEYLTETESTRAALFEKFVEEVVQCIEQGEDELQRSYGSPGSAPRVIRSRDGDDDDKQEGRRNRKNQKLAEKAENREKREAHKNSQDKGNTAH
mmetsp:Transcript_116242/g.276312  ORF Transcript_116242/g.276312 Transcript_116242/m.276312 type:complete len:456 (+) Transcript_116242:98-1465(+)